MLYEYLAKEQREEPSVCHCGVDDNLKGGEKYGPVIRDIFIVECCTGGAGSVIIEGKEFMLKKGDCFFLFPKDTVIHTADFKIPRTGVWCAIDGLGVGEILKKAGVSSACPFAPKESFEEIKNILYDIYDMRNEKDSGADLRRTALVYSILGALMKHTTVLPDKNMWVKKAIGIMETDYHEDITVKDIAESIGLDRSYFSTLFKMQTGRTPYAYFTSLRIKKACTLMRQNGVCVSEAAQSVGLDPVNFSRIFKRETGRTPKEYIKSFEI